MSRPYFCHFPRDNKIIESDNTHFLYFSLIILNILKIYNLFELS